MNEDIKELLKQINLDRFKILQMTLLDNVNRNQEVEKFRLGTEDFEEFVEKYKEFNPIVERDIDIKESNVFINPEIYLMIIVDNKQIKIANLLIEDNLSNAINRCNIDINVFNQGYLQQNTFNKKKEVYSL